MLLLHRDGFNTPASGPFHAEHQGGWPDVPGMAQWRVGGGAGAPRQRIVLASAVTAGNNFLPLLLNKLLLLLLLLLLSCPSADISFLLLPLVVAGLY